MVDFVLSLNRPFAYGSQINRRKKNNLKIQYLLTVILSKNTVLLFLEHPVQFLIFPYICEHLLTFGNMC